MTCLFFRTVLRGRTLDTKNSFNRFCFVGPRAFVARTVFLVRSTIDIMLYVLPPSFETVRGGDVILYIKEAFFVM